MRSGDFSHLAQDYAKYRVGYSSVVANALFKYVGAFDDGFTVADIGSGTGIWSKMLLEAGLRCTCVEPNDAMRQEGIASTSGYDVEWRKGSGEATMLPSGAYNWVTMASSFHWVEAKQGLAEFKRILKPGGYFTALWNPRNIEGNALHEEIEQTIYEIVPELQRKSSGHKKHIDDMYALFKSSGDFGDVIFMEAKYTINRSKEDYLGTWISVNDIQVQAGQERFARIMNMIEQKIMHLDIIPVPYLTRAWTARVSS